ncbi:MAG: ABC transporter transmembrane domain-containing protein, partial [Dehalococcoidia bacterium]|nr:ABC transporter transmembrane domain-containing protein [Dehalococcoidia bacterium]
MHPLPPEVKQLIEPALDGESVDLVVESDLADDGQLGRQWLIVTPKRLVVVGETDGIPVLERQISRSEVVDARAEPMIGSGCLFVNVSGELVPLIRYTNSLAKEFGHVARRLQAAAKGEKPPATTDEDRTRRCPNCAFPLAAGSQVCPNCIDRARAVRRLLGYVGPYKWLTILASLLLLVNQSLLLLPPYLTKILVDDILLKAEKLQDTAAGVPPDQTARLAHMLALIVIALVGAKILGTALGIFQSRISAFLGSRMVHDIRMELYSALERLTVGFFDKRQTGAVISRVSQDTSSLQDFLSGDVQMMMANLLVLILVTVILFVQNWQLAALTILPAPFASVAATIVFTRLRWVFRRVWHRWSKLHSVMSDS